MDAYTNARIKSLRLSIDNIDSALVDILSLRLFFVKELSAIKKAENMPMTDTGREKEILINVSVAARAHGIDESEVVDMYSHIFAMSKKVQETL